MRSNVTCMVRHNVRPHRTMRRSVDRELGVLPVPLPTRSVKERRHGGNCMNRAAVLFLYQYTTVRAL
eukprot:7253856-Pyramimonas_sp.AAC.1